jgi:hypothetical protein
VSIQTDYIYTSRAKDAALHFLQTAFGSPRLFGDTRNKYLYSDDEKSTSIMIADFNTTNLNSVNVKPALLVSRGNISPKQLGLGDKTRQTFLAAQEERELLLNVSMSVNCYAREGLEAEFLAVVVFKLFRYMNQQIQKRYDIYDVAALGVSGEQDIRPDLSMVSVMLSMAVPDSVKLSFNEIQINKLHTDGAVFQSPIPGQTT